MRIAVLCSDARHPVFGWLERWRARRAGTDDVALATQSAALEGGDLLLLVSCHEILAPELRAKYRKVLVLHASDVPEGRGWSPYIWQVLEGRNRIVVSLLEARDAVDSGAVWAQRAIALEGHELLPEIEQKLFAAELDLMDFAVAHLDSAAPREQDAARTPTVYRRRTPEDSRLDPTRSIAEQFDLLRVCDAERYPAFFELRGCRYIVTVRKAEPPGA
ncbi:MAG TPA: formyltransferase family protein [Burkholderiales bacterium]|nr:formyltransferase family protein [Burkholderiales bacterium]